MRFQNVFTTILLSFLLFAGCKKEQVQSIQPKITFTIKGRLLKDCSGTPAAQETLEPLYYEQASSHLLKDVITGRGTTDSGGYFTIVCTTYFTEGVLYLKEAWMSLRKGGIGLKPQDGAVYDLGDLYETYTAKALFQLNIAQQHPDTLWITSWSGDDDFYVYPASGTHYIPVQHTFVGQPFEQYDGYYSFSRASIKQYPAGSTDPRNIVEMHAFKICGEADTTVLNIP